MTAAPTAAAERIYVGKQQDFLNDSRQLVKHGVRNIAVVLHDGRFYAFDNACYHHGGALFRGDIEEMGGHPCIVCPWHSYRITLDTGEGLYVGITIDPTNPGSKPKQSVNSKGKKQRVYPVTVDADGSIYIEYDVSGPKVESDTYANMAIANQEEATSAPVSSGTISSSNRGPRLHSTGLGMELRSGHVFQAMRAGGNANAIPPRSGAFDVGLAALSNTGGSVRRANAPLPSHAGMNQLTGLSTISPTSLPTRGGNEERPQQPDSGALADKSASCSVRRGAQGAPDTVASTGQSPVSRPSVSCVLMEEICTDVKQFSFVCCSGTTQRHWKLGECVELELPIRSHSGQPLRRKWTVSAVNHENTLFTIVVKRVGTDIARSGSAWLHACALHTILPLCRTGGSFTMIDHAQRIRHAHGQVLWLTAGIGITSAYANMRSTLSDGCFVQATTEPLHILHMHVDRHADGVAKLQELVTLTREFPNYGPIQFSTAASRADNDENGSGAGGGGVPNSTGLTAFMAEPPPSFLKSYTLRLFLTKETVKERPASGSSDEASDGSRRSRRSAKKAKTDKKGGEDAKLQEFVATGLSRAPNAVKYGCRYGYEDIAGAVREVFTASDTEFLAYLCGPPSFVDMCTSALLSLGVAESDILTDDP